MTVKELYRYKEGKGYAVSPRKPDTTLEYELRYRLIADDDKAITDGDTVTYCIDVMSPEGWTDCEAPEEEDYE